ncbi:MAG: hypothetical protein ACPGPE_03660 [Planctomycetota bacterium]
MISFRRPIDSVFVAVAALLGALAFGQWRKSSDFADHALQATATVVSVRETKKQILDAAPEIYARVEFTTDGGDVVRAELPDPFRASAAPAPREASSLIIWYDPREPTTARLQRGAGREGVLVLLVLAVGALFAPAVLQRSLSGSAGGG